MTKLEKRNKYFFGLGTVGRDMFYAFESNALLTIFQRPLPARRRVRGGEHGAHRCASSTRSTTP
ncbi:MAG: hypothetical protein ACLUEK_15990 [Oscillospiraceae bacterium]